MDVSNGFNLPFKIVSFLENVEHYENLLREQPIVTHAVSHIRVIFNLLLIDVM